MSSTETSAVATETTPSLEKTNLGTGVEILGRMKRENQLTIADMRAVATALMPAYKVGDKLRVSQVDQVALGCEALIRSGVQSGEGAMLVEHYATLGEDWRVRFWTSRLEAVRINSHQGLDRDEIVAVMEEPS